MEWQIVINIASLPLFAPIALKQNTDKNSVTPLTTKTSHSTVQKSVLVDMQNNFMGNPYKLENTHNASTSTDIILGVQVRLYTIEYLLIRIINVF